MTNNKNINNLDQADILIQNLLGKRLDLFHKLCEVTSFSDAEKIAYRTKLDRIFYDLHNIETAVKNQYNKNI